MAYSTQRVISDGSLVLLDISIVYFDRSEISVYFDNVVQTTGWSWVGSTEKKISFTPAVPTGVEVMLVRTTDLSEPRHVFSEGAQFTEGSLDESFRQVLHIAQEARENANIEDVYRELNMHGYKIINLGPGTNPGDAMSIGQAESFINEAEALVVQADTAADLAQDWATKTTGPVAGTEYSAKHHAQQAAQSASDAGDAAAAAVASHVASPTPHADMAKVNVAQAFTAPQRSPILVDNDGNFDLSAKQNFKCTTSGAVTLQFSNPADGLSGSVLFVNAGNHSVSAHVGTKLTVSDLAKLSVTGTYRIDYLSDGTSAYCSIVGPY